MICTIKKRLFTPGVRRFYSPDMERSDFLEGGTEAWERQAKNIVRGELMKRGMSQEHLVERLAELGIRETLPNLRNKLSRGRFTAVWLLQILAAIDVEWLHLPDPPGTPAGASSTQAWRSSARPCCCAASTTMPGRWRR